MNKNMIPIYSDPQARHAMRKAGRLAAQVLSFIEPFVQEGAVTEELDQRCHEFICDHGAIPAPLGYKGFPKSTCISVNQVVCHGIPDARRLKKGDIVNIDVTVILDGWYGDTSRMFVIPPIHNQAKRLISITQESLFAGIAIVKPGAFFGDIGYVIQNIVERAGFSVVYEFCGHGIGRVFHGPPEVMHCGAKGTGPLIKEGMFFTIEPMVNLGKPEVVILDDGWTAVTRDGRLSAQMEHTIFVTPEGSEIMTIL